MPASAEANPFRAPAEHIERHGRPLTVRDLRSLWIFAAAYFAACGYGSLFGQTRAAPLWFPDSVLRCALLLTPFGKWWLYLLAAQTGPACAHCQSDSGCREALSRSCR
jgi:hypothetical protein